MAGTSSTRQGETRARKRGRGDPGGGRRRGRGGALLRGVDPTSGQSRDERRVLGRGQSGLQHCEEGIQVLGEQRLSIEPHSGEDFRAVNTVRGGRHEGESVATTDVPEHFIGVEGHDAILEDAGPFVIGALGPEVDPATRTRDFHDQLRAPAMKPSSRRVRPPRSGRMKRDASGWGSASSSRRVEALSAPRTPRVNR